MLQFGASLIDAARGVIYDRHMSIVQASALIDRRYFRALGFYLNGTSDRSPAVPGIEVDTF
jgi:hypothetical protein